MRQEIVPPHRSSKKDFDSFSRAVELEYILMVAVARSSRLLRGCYNDPSWVLQ